MIKRFCRKAGGKWESWDIQRQRTINSAQEDCGCKAHHHDHADCACAHTDGHDRTTMPAMGRMHMKTTDTIIMKAAVPAD